MATSYNCTAWPADLEASLVVDCAGNLSSTGEIPSDLFDSLKTTIVLPSNGLSGNLSLVGLATSLEVLNLKDNSIAGKIPPHIGNLTSLRELDLSDNLLDGNIPSSFDLLSSLTFLNLSGNSFSGCVPCPSLSAIGCAPALPAAIQSNGSQLFFCATSAPSLPSNGESLGIETFNTDNQFVVAMSGLAGGLAFLFVYCMSSAVFLRRKRVLQRAIAGDGLAPPLEEVPAVQLRDSSSNRPGALSFDGREGWRSDTELRTSARTGSNPRPFG